MTGLPADKRSGKVSSGVDARAQRWADEAGDRAGGSGEAPAGLTERYKAALQRIADFEDERCNTYERRMVSIARAALRGQGGER